MRSTRGEFGVLEGDGRGLVLFFIVGNVLESKQERASGGWQDM